MPPKTEEVNTVTTTIAEYSATAAALSSLRSRLGGAKYDVATTAGMDTAKKDRRELVTLRTDLEKKRKEIKAPALERCKQIDTEAKRITDELLKLEQPIDEQIKAEETRKEAIKAEKERIERERVEGIRQRITKLQNLPLMTVGMNAADLEIFIARVEAQQIGADFQEFENEAEQAKCEVLGKLKEAHAALVTAEEEAARVKAEQEAEAARLEAIRIEQEAAAEVERKKLAEERAELDRLRAADEARRKEEAAKAKAEREEADRIAAEERARQQAIIDAEREKFQKEQAEAARVERERQAKEQAERAEAERIATEKAEAEEAAKETVTILKAEYDQLLKDSALLNALEAAGVDNWSGWDEARASMREAE